METKTCQSPVKPDRSRCGQSVGTAHALVTRLRRTTSCNCSSRGSLHSNWPVRGRSSWTSTPRAPERSSPSGTPSTWTYRKPCVVCRGSNTSPGRPAETTSSTWPAGSGCPVAKSNALRCSVSTRPCSSTTSPWVRVSRVPAGPRSGSRSQPVSSSPRSRTTVPGRGRLVPIGAISRLRRVTGPLVATSRSRFAITGSAASASSSSSTGCHPSPPPRNQSGSDSRRSSVWPSIRSAVTIWLGRLSHDPSVATIVRSDPGSPVTSDSSRPLRSPQPSARRWKPCRPRNQPSESSTAIVFEPGRRRAVTSYSWTWSRFRYAVKPGVSSRSPTREPLTYAS